MKTKAQLEARITELTRIADKLHLKNVALEAKLSRYVAAPQRNLTATEMGEEPEPGEPSAVVADLIALREGRA